MLAFPRRLSAAVCVVLLAGAGVVATPVPASATVTTLCVGYTGCARLGMSTSGYSAANSTMYWRMYSGHNCTNYAAYRMVRSGMPNTRPWSGGGNATYWGTSMSRITDGTPKVGSVAWWRAGVYPAGSAGHVAYVERVVSADEIVVSMDSWRGDFSWARITRSRGWPSGFIHFNDVRMTNTALPRVTGTPKVGSRLTATPGTWNAPDATYTYQWLADGNPIQGATSTALTPTQPLTDKKLSVRVTARADGYPAGSAVSAATAAVQPGVISNTTPPTIAGDPAVDSTLTALPGTWSPAPVGLRYQWLADGAPVTGATTPTLALAPSLVGKAIRVRVTARRAGYAAVARLSASSPAVRPGTQTLSGAPSLSGRSALGGLLRVGAVGAAPGARVRVQWQRGGMPVRGATGSSYRITRADLGHSVRAKVRVTRPGYTPLVVRSPWSRRIRTKPVMRLSVQPGSNRLTFRAIVRAAGVPPIDGVVKVRSRGKLVRTVPLRNGVASATLSGLRNGTRTYRFRVPVTTATQRTVALRRVTIR